MMEYTKIHMSIDTEWMHTYIPECWAALVPLKAEFYKGKSIRIVAVIIVLTLRLICTISKSTLTGRRLFNVQHITEINSITKKNIKYYSQ